MMAVAPLPYPAPTSNTPVIPRKLDFTSPPVSRSHRSSAPAASASAPSATSLVNPLVNAASEGKVVTLMQLLDLGADPNLPNKRGLTALHKAAINNQAASAVTLIERGAIVDAVEPKHGRTPLMLAAFYGSQTCLEVLLDKDASTLEARASNGWPCIFFAASQGQCEIVEALLAWDGFPRALSAKAEDGTSVLDLARSTLGELKRRAKSKAAKPSAGFALDAQKKTVAVLEEASKDTALAHAESAAAEKARLPSEGWGVDKEGRLRKMRLTSVLSRKLGAPGGAKKKWGAVGATVRALTRFGAASGGGAGAGSSEDEQPQAADSGSSFSGKSRRQRTASRRDRKAANRGATTGTAEATEQAGGEGRNSFMAIWGARRNWDKFKSAFGRGGHRTEGHPDELRIKVSFA